MNLEVNLSKGMTTYMAALFKVLQTSDGDVIEIGTGPFSTPFLHYICKEMRRNLISYESDAEFYQLAKQYESKNHQIIYFSDINQTDTKTHRGVVFIDAKREITPLFKEAADYVIVHGSMDENFDFENVKTNFKYSYVSKEESPWVWVFSNFNDLYLLNSEFYTGPDRLKNQLTVLYYTSSREKPEFEEKIVKNLLSASGDLPIISVSQKPLNLGKNICVGDVGLSYSNEWRQILIGAKEVKTKYIIFAESDFLYPEEYFQFVPPRSGLYRYDNIWVIFKDTTIAGSARRKSYSEGAQICDKHLIIETYEKFLEGKPQWFSGPNVTPNKKDEENTWMIHNMPFEFFSGDTAAITFKTGEGVHVRTNVINKGTEDNRKMNLPYWGNVNELRDKYLS